MALQGTLKDFGIAEILQLIGQQAKSGVLHLESRDEQIHIAIADGNVVRAESAGRKAHEKLGTLLLRADLISRLELEAALDIQKRTLRRLGDILVEQGSVDVKALREMTALQTTETVYRLFHWKSGTYAFEPGEVDWDPETVTPLRAESVLMEGFRQVDEWPLVRKRISSTAMTFERARPLPPPGKGPVPDAADLDAAFDAVSGGPEPAAKGDDGDGAVTPAERRVYELAVPDRTVERIVDLSRLGEFETCKALYTLVNQGYLAPVAPRSRSRVGAAGRSWAERIRRGALRAVATLAIAAALAGLAAFVEARTAGEGPGVAPLGDNATQRFLARAQLGRLRGALEVYRLERGQFPERLEQLLEAGLAAERDLRYPFAQPYHYRRGEDGGYVLLPPVE